MTGGFQKADWHWKRTPKPLPTVKKVAAPTKRRRLKTVLVKAAERDQLPTFAEARKLAVEQGRATPAPDTKERTSAPPRRAWSGKYADLTPPSRDAL